MALSSQYYGGQYPPTAIEGGHLSANINLDPRASPGLNRTPSPTPSEQKELQTGALDLKAMMNWRFWLRKEWFWYYVILIIIATLTALMTIYHDQIVTWLTPFTKWVHDLRFGWLIPIAILFVISFPPLFGHEIVAVLCGLVWGLGVGFAIVCAGTFLGEVGNFYAFKYCCRARGEKMEKTKISYACLARCVREGGFKIALIARLSAIPGHFTTAIFATCGMNIFIFCLAAFLSLPKQFITVYLGVIFGQDGQESTKQKILSDGVVAVTLLITVGACWYILRKMNEAKPTVIYERRKARQAKMNSGGVYSTSSMNSSEVFDSYGSQANIPLTAQKPQFGYGGGQGQAYPFAAPYQRSSSGNIVYAPKPQHQQRYSPENGYGEDLSDSDDYGNGGVGHVAPGGLSNPAYNYTPTRQTSDEVGFDAAGPSGGAVGSAPATTSPHIPSGVPNLPRTQSPETFPSPASRPMATSSYAHPQSNSSTHSSPYPIQSQSQPSSPYIPYQTPASVTSQSNSYTPTSASYQPPPGPPPQSQSQPYIVHTPTQVQYAAYTPPVHSAPDSGRLPSPGFSSPSHPSSPVIGPMGGMHSPVATPTQMQYTTPHAYSSHQYEPTNATYHPAMASSDSAGFPPNHPYDHPPPTYTS